MKIGIDLDGVIFDTERYFRFYADMWDIEHHGLDNVKDESEVRFQERYSWSSDEIEEFYESVVFDLEENSGFIPGVKEVLTYLKSQGYELYVITARGFFSEKQIEITKRLFKEANLDIFEEYIFKTKDKKEVILDKKIDYMIEDNINICNDIKDICKTIYFKDAYTRDINDDTVTTVRGWHEIYRYFKKIEKEG